MENLKTEQDIIQLWKDFIEKPKVSICCTAYNNELYIEDALKGFLFQETNFPFEILIHDDASTDKTREIIRRYAAKYPRIIKPIYQTENQYSKGKRVNFTFNYSRAKGKYIALCEGDDYWTDSKKLQRQVEILEENKQVMLCVHATSVLNVSNQQVEANKIRLNKSDKLINAKEVILGGGEFGHTSSCVFRRNIIHDPPQWYLDYPSGDTPLRLLSVHVGSMYYLDKDMSLYRRGVKGSWTSKVKNNKQFISHWKKGIKLFEEYDKFTKYKYTNTIKKRISKIAYRILSRLNSSNYDEKEYEIYYSYLIVKDKLKFNLKTKQPWLFNTLKKVISP